MKKINLLTVLSFVVILSNVSAQTQTKKDTVNKSDTIIRDSAMAIHLYLNNSPNSGKIIINVNPPDNSSGGGIGKKDTSDRIHDTLAINSICFTGTTYDNINSVRDNDPGGFSQYVVDLSVPLNIQHGIILHSINDKFSHWIPFRNFFIQTTYSPLAYKYDSIITTIKNERLVNRLDLLQYSTLNTRMYINIGTLLILDDGLKMKKAPRELFHLYFDLMVGFLITSDSIQKLDDSIHRGNINIPSALYGIHIDLMSQKAISEYMTFDLGFQLFQINPFTSSVDPYLNPQLHNINDTILQSNSKKPFQRVPEPLYFNIDGTISSTYFSKFINIGTTTNSKSIEVFLHADVYSNYKKSQVFDNTYYQIQLGTSINF